MKGSKTWSKLDSSGPSPRGSHSSVIVGTKMYIFGGFDGTKHYNDLWCLDLRKEFFFFFLNSNPFFFFKKNIRIENMSWQNVNCQGTPPTPRSGHSLNAIASNKFLMVVGGCDCYTNFLNDVHLFNLETQQWINHVNVQGTPLSPRFRHTAIVEGKSLYIFGGTSPGISLNDLYVLECVEITQGLFFFFFNQS